MTEAAILVVTTVHSADDTRIRERLIRSLEGVGSITYATREPGPTDRSGLDWVPLSGGRFRRNLRALRLILGTKWRLVILHDPETIPAGALAHFLRHRPIVFDVHEDLPAQVVNKEWAPTWTRPILRWVAKGSVRPGREIARAHPRRTGIRAAVHRRPPPGVPQLPPDQRLPQCGDRG